MVDRFSALEHIYAEVSNRASDA